MSHVRSAVRYVPASSFRAVYPLDWIVTAEPQKRRRQEKTDDSVVESQNRLAAWSHWRFETCSAQIPKCGSLCGEICCAAKISFFCLLLMVFARSSRKVLVMHLSQSNQSNPNLSHVSHVTSAGLTTSV